MKNFNQDNLFYAALTCCMLYLIRTQAYWEIPKIITQVLLLASVSIAGCAAAIKIPQYKPKELIFLVIFFFLTVIVGYNAQLMQRVVLTYLLLVGAKGVPINKIFKIYLIIGGSFMALTICASYLGIIKESTLESGIDREMTYTSVGTRSSLGYASPTDLANHFLYLLTTFWLYCKGKIKWSTLGIICILIFYIVSVSGSRLSFFCSIILVVAAILFKFKKNNKHITTKKITLTLIAIVSFLLIPLSVYFTNSYDENDITWLAMDLLFSGRLRLGNNAILENGFCMFGQYYEMIGCAEAVEGVIETNYIDNSYIQLFVLYGFAYASVIIGIMLYLSYKAIKRNLSYIVIAVLIISTEGVIAHHYMMIEFNALLLSCTAVLPAAISPQKQKLLILINYIYGKNKRRAQKTNS